MTKKFPTHLRRKTGAKKKMKNYHVKINEEKYKYGYVRGTVNDFCWYALVHKEQIDHGINPENLEKGQGRISRLCIYKDVVEPLGNPYLPASRIRRYIYANYKRDWDVLSSSHIDMIKYLVNYLERRYSFRLIQSQVTGTEDKTH